MIAVKIPDFVMLSSSFPRERISTFADNGVLPRNEENDLVFESLNFKREARPSNLEDESPRRLEDERYRWPDVLDNSNLRTSILLQGIIIWLLQSTMKAIGGNGAMPKRNLFWENAFWIEIVCETELLRWGEEMIGNKQSKLHESIESKWVAQKNS